MYRMNIAGAPGHGTTNAGHHTLTPQALELVRRGYWITIVHTDNPDRGIEIHQQDGEIVTARFDHTGHPRKYQPTWMDQAEADLRQLLQRTT